GGNNTSGGYGDNRGSGGYSGPDGYEDYSGSGGYGSSSAGNYRTGASGASNAGASPLEDQQRRDFQRALDRARRDPPRTEIASGRALNVLLANLSAQMANGQRGPDVPLDDGVLARINVSAKSEGDIGLLRDEGKLRWPASLQGAAFAEARLHMTGVMAKA